MGGLRACQKVPLLTTCRRWQTAHRTSAIPRGMGACPFRPRRRRCAQFLLWVESVHSVVSEHGTAGRRHPGRPGRRSGHRRTPDRRRSGRHPRVVGQLDWHHERVVLVGDAREPETAQRAAAATAEATGPLLGWVNHAAIFRDAGLVDASAAQILDLITANLALAPTVQDAVGGRASNSVRRAPTGPGSRDRAGLQDQCRLVSDQRQADFDRREPSEPEG